MSKGFNKYVERQKECHDVFEDAEQPITNTQLVAKGQLHVGQTGLFKEKYLTWKHRAIAVKTWNDFRAYWNREFADYNTLNKLTSHEAGFGANAAVEQAQSNMS
eukprot:4401686-Ditylum_brightwellii.AAC.1